MNSDNFDRLSANLAGTTSRRKALKLMGGGLLGGLVAAKGASIAAQRPVQGGTAQLIDSTGILPAGTLSNLVATFDRATGVVSVAGTFTTATQGADDFVADVLPGSTGACEVLNLVLGPLHLDLLGLVVDLNQVVLNITAEPGPGNLLGNLLCAVAGLLDGASGNALSRLLNRIFGLLGLA